MDATPRLRRPFQWEDLRVAGKVAKAVVDRDRPLITHLVITRRCNLACGYCFEYDKVSPPVPTDVLEQRLSHLAALKSVFVTLTGGESLLHPDAAHLVRYARNLGMIPFLNTNGYLLTKKWIDALNAAGLYGMQISIDNVEPNDVSKKSLRLLLPKLRLLARHARFRVRINTVLGSSAPEEALEVGRAAVALGFDTNCSLVRDDSGALMEPTPRTREVYAEIRGLGRRLPSFMDDTFTQTLLDEGAIDWKCRAGARTFMVCEDGLVHLCQPRMGVNTRPLLEYTALDIRAAFNEVKPCAKHCPIAYAHHASKFDGWRSQKGPKLLMAPPPVPPPPPLIATAARRSTALAIVL